MEIRTYLKAEFVLTTTPTTTTQWGPVLTARKVELDTGHQTACVWLDGHPVPQVYPAQQVRVLSAKTYLRASVEQPRALLGVA